jgi:hypothetical protein
MAVCGLRDKELQQALIRGVSCGVRKIWVDRMGEWGAGKARRIAPNLTEQLTIHFSPGKGKGY